MKPIHWKNRISKNGRVWVSECGFVDTVSRNIAGRIDDSTWAKFEIEVTCSFCVSALIAKHRAAIIVLESQNFDFMIPVEKTVSLSLKELSA